MGRHCANQTRTREIYQRRNVSTFRRPLKPVPDFGHPLLSLHSMIGNQALGRILQAKLKANEPGDRYKREADAISELLTGTPDRKVSGIPKGSTKLPRKCADCASGRELCPTCNRPSRKFFTPGEVMEGGEEKIEEETPRKTNSDASKENEPLIPHAGDATIECKAGAYVVNLGDWAGTTCDQPDCVKVHEESHIRDWQKRWPNGCKKEDGTNQPDGYLPTGGEGYDEFLKKSECDAHIADLKCAEDKKKSATGDCKKTWENYIKSTEKEKKKFCSSGC